MTQQLSEGEGRKKLQKRTLKAGLLEPKLTDDSVVGDEVDPAGSFDPEEFVVVGRDSNSSVREFKL
jgi:hypothetical protein